LCRTLQRRKTKGIYRAADGIIRQRSGTDANAFFRAGQYAAAGVAIRSGVENAVTAPDSGESVGVMRFGRHNLTCRDGFQAGNIIYCGWHNLLRRRGKALPVKGLRRRQGWLDYSIMSDPEKEGMWRQ